MRAARAGALTRDGGKEEWLKEMWEEVEEMRSKGKPQS